jgi:hypothetical protein
MDLPGHGVVGGQWDLRGREEDYLGGVSLQGKRVLELGTASGHLCRYMESQGADVVGFDLPAGELWNLVPFVGFDLDAYKPVVNQKIERLKNGWWFAHQLLGSRAKVVYGNIYDIPESIGPVDVATFGAILLHLRDPFQALHSALRLTRETAIVTEVHPDQPAGSKLGAVEPESTSRLKKSLKQLLIKARVISPPYSHPGRMYFLPAPGMTDRSLAASWWCFPPEVICRFLGVLGFADQTVTEHFQIVQGQQSRVYTVVGRRSKSA